MVSKIIIPVPVTAHLRLERNHSIASSGVSGRSGRGIRVPRTMLSYPIDPSYSQSDPKPEAFHPQLFGGQTPLKYPVAQKPAMTILSNCISL